MVAERLSPTRMQPLRTQLKPNRTSTQANFFLFVILMIETVFYSTVTFMGITYAIVQQGKSKDCMGGFGAIPYFMISLGVANLVIQPLRFKAAVFSFVLQFILNIWFVVFGSSLVYTAYPTYLTFFDRCEHFTYVISVMTVTLLLLWMVSVLIVFTVFNFGFLFIDQKRRVR